jgi:hypothetical protein
MLVAGAPAQAQDTTPSATSPRTPSPGTDPFFLELQERTFRFFWDTANPQNGLVPDRYPTPSYSSIAAVGFGLTTYPVGVERGYITRAQARQRVLTTLRFFSAARQSSDPRGASGHRGFFYHFLDMKTGERFEDSELSTVDTAILLAGALFCQSYFDGADPEEVEIRALVDAIYRRVDWRWAQPKAPAISLGWSPEDGFLRYDWRGYNEAMLVYLLALASPTFPVGADAWAEPGVPDLSAAVRPSVHARVGGSPRHPGSVHAASWPRLLREQSACGLRPASLRDGQPAPVP